MLRAEKLINDGVSDEEVARFTPPDRVVDRMRGARQRNSAIRFGERVFAEVSRKIRGVDHSLSVNHGLSHEACA